MKQQTSKRNSLTAYKQNFYLNNLQKMLEQGYCLMPNEVLYNKELTDKQKLLFWAISNLCAEKWYCRASNEYIWELLNADKWTISKNIAKLHDKWFINIEISQKDWNQRKITIAENNIPIVENDYTYSQKWQEGYSQKWQHNNTSINNTIEKKENKKEKKWYGEFGMCYLTDSEYSKVIADYWLKNWEHLIKQVDTYCASKWKRYKNYAAAIRQFAERAGIKKIQKQTVNESWVYDLPF